MKRKQQMTQTRQAILSAAKQLFAEKGFEGTTIRAVAVRAGVGTGTVNLHFPDKISLLGEAIYEDIEAILQRHSLPEGAPLDVRLGELVRPLFEYYARQPALSRVLVKESLMMRGQWGQRFDQQLQTFTGSMKRELLAAQGCGELDPGYPVSTLIEALLAYYIALVIEGLRSEKPEPAELVKRFRRLVSLHTVVGPKDNKGK
ncbi:TetR/AcrR family transcriptional regulator [Thiohalomonas denitrificans]|uniref:Transcriptional regulator, TetR family n=1 Tax=Thiohalomonas denitrificans TaxID=415747 RepID=A0A1G5PSA5_9GAMM|nr:TetR/AcrR family transcriptional regulator [Thiohalomonas denitrificans]SCZ52238.1 transcriptional regulator, TetR family [Thiohalomonas denitrificans]